MKWIAYYKATSLPDAPAKETEVETPEGIEGFHFAVLAASIRVANLTASRGHLVGLMQFDVQEKLLTDSFCEGSG